MNAAESATPVRGVGKDVLMSERAGAVADTADQRRGQMLRAALDVIEERGFPDTRIADVAARAGTSPPWSSTTSRPKTSCSPRRCGMPRTPGTRRACAGWR